MTMSPEHHEAWRLMGEAIAASNNLVVFLKDHPGLVQKHTWERVVEGDYLLNSAVGDVIDFVGEFPPPAEGAAA